jgi:hypothetical protein
VRGAQLLLIGIGHLEKRVVIKFALRFWSGFYPVCASEGEIRLHAV